MNFKQFTLDCRARIETKLEEVLPPESQAPTKLHSAMRYAVLGGGKRVRPMLVYATGKSLGLALETMDAPAAAIEIMHAFSLIHDDLPAMDNDDLRRGKPTVHIAYDEATAILAADALQPLAFEILATDPALNGVNSLRGKMVRTLAQACGSKGMTGGQSIDLEAEGLRLSKSEIEHMYTLKTGKLLSACVLIPAYCSLTLSRDAAQRLCHFVDQLGLAFQIRDDILDIEGATETIGKMQGADQVMDKATWPALFGIDEAKTRTEELLASALAEIESFGAAAEPLRHIAQYIVNRSS
jgi:geranylgeranyl pyrophosphate synthase